MVVVDRDEAPDVALLKSAQGGGRIGGVQLRRRHGFDAAQLKRRLQAIKAAGLGWKDFWVPGKN